VLGMWTTYSQLSKGLFTEIREVGEGGFEWKKVME
jgi:hypothetical protein